MEREPFWQAARDWVDAWNTRDLDAIMDHYADDVTFWSPTVVTRWGTADGRLHGKNRVREHFARGLTAPGLHFELLDVLLGAGGYTVVYRRETGALVVDAVTVDEHGRGLEVRAYSGQPSTERTDP